MTRSSYFVDFKEDKDNTFPEYIDILLHLYKYFVPVSYCVCSLHTWPSAGVVLGCYVSSYVYACLDKLYTILRISVYIRLMAPFVPNTWNDQVHS